jgi:hypothetical protein
MTEAGIEITLQEAKEKFHRQGLQGVHSDLGNDARPDLSVSPAIEQEDRALAQIA